MSLGFILWLLVTGFLIWFWGWTTYILVCQKKAWKAYASQNSLRYRPNNLLDSPEISGALHGYAVTVFATDHGGADQRSQRMMTTIEVTLKSVLPSPCAVASGGMVKLVQELELAQEFRPNHPSWDVSYIARAREVEVLEAYLTPPRVEVLAKLMKRKRTWSILIFGGEIGLLRVDTSDPLDNPQKLSQLINSMIDAARMLELEAGEDKVIASKRSKDSGKNAVLKVDQDVLEKGANLALEEE